MNGRLQQFLLAENISQSQFADRIGVGRASISHILAGRNKPGYEFLENLARAYPNLNLEWLLLGKGKMYKTSPDAASPPEACIPFPAVFAYASRRSACACRRARTLQPLHSKCPFWETDA
jgi:transcriptional regulator with XRE-family HTH domain